MDIKIESKNISDLCNYCFGTGKQKAMQMALTAKRETIRAIDTLVICENCKGLGFKK